MPASWCSSITPRARAWWATNRCSGRSAARRGSCRGSSAGRPEAVDDHRRMLDVRIGVYGVYGVLAGMKKVSLAEARDRLSALVNDAAHGGQRIVLSSRGRPKAVLIGM